MELKGDSGGGIDLRLERREADLLRLALKRATFEDTPADSLQDVIDFAMQLMSELGEG